MVDLRRRSFKFPAVVVELASLVGQEAKPSSWEASDKLSKRPLRASAVASDEFFRTNSADWTLADDVATGAHEVDEAEDDSKSLIFGSGSTGCLAMGSMAAVGRWCGVKTRAFDKLGLTVATFFGSDALGKARAFGSSRLDDGRVGFGDSELSSNWLLPAPVSLVVFLASATNCCKVVKQQQH